MYELVQGFRQKCLWHQELTPLFLLVDPETSHTHTFRALTHAERCMEGEQVAFHVFFPLVISSLRGSSEYWAFWDPRYLLQRTKSQELAPHSCTEDVYEVSRFKSKQPRERLSFCGEKTRGFYSFYRNDLVPVYNRLLAVDICLILALRSQCFE